MPAQGGAVPRSARLEKGDRVTAQWGLDDDELWFDGVIVKVHAGGGLVDVLYDDGDQECEKPAERVLVRAKEDGRKGGGEAATRKRSLTKPPGGSGVGGGSGMAGGSDDNGDEGGHERCAICLDDIDVDGPEPSLRDQNAWGHAPCCGNYFHRRCLAIWFHGGGEDGDNQAWAPAQDGMEDITVPIQKRCPTCNATGWGSRGLRLGRR